MKLNEQWLREWVNPAIDNQQLAHQLTMAGLEVDSVEPVAADFSGVVVGLVKETKAHPDADKLTLCEVDVGGSDLLSIVCGASNVRDGLKVAVATIGAALPGLKIKKTKLRGALSEGMLCSASELGLVESSEGIMELDEDAPIGEDLRQYLQLDDVSIDVDLTPNRADCLSVMGIAREVATLNNMPLNPITIDAVKPRLDEAIDITIHEPEYCAQYCGRIIKNIKRNAQTPLWLKERLRRCGIRPIHPVVDITNYVMLELGQPMHAFDLEKLNGGINVRLAKAQESLLLLDGQEITLRDDTLVIADDENALAIAGVMGGLDSGVIDETQHILLESAFFNPVKIAGVARSYGLTTDSSHRFERGVDPNLQQQAIERATQLILDTLGGEAAAVLCQKQPSLLPQTTTVTLRASRVKELLGVDIDEQVMKDNLTLLGMSVNDEQQPWQVSVPPHRFDIAIEADLIEEIGRIYGYDKLEEQVTIARLDKTCTDESITVNRRASEFLANLGYAETISYSFVDPNLQEAIYPEQKNMQLLNPISSELSQMRLGMWPGLLASLVYNQHRQVNNLKLFETGLSFTFEGDELQQQGKIAGLIAGKFNAEHWHSDTRNVDFYDIKGDVEALISHLTQSQDLEFVPKQHPALHPGQSAHISINGIAAGWCGMIHPMLANSLDISTPVMVFELSVAALCQSSQPRYQAISKFPMISRDLAFLADDSVLSQDIVTMIWSESKENWLKSVDVFDVYSGSGIPEGKKSIALGLTLQHASRTLIDEEISDFIAAIIKKLSDNLKLQLRE